MRSFGEILKSQRRKLGLTQKVVVRENKWTSDDDKHIYVQHTCGRCNANCSFR